MGNAEKKFKFKKHQAIGSPDAETDKILKDVFIEIDAIESLNDMNNQKCIIIGRTGAGKTAILQHLEESYEKVARINPEAMSLRYLANSTILNYFNALGINLNFFYKVLWKHVFIIELLKLYFGTDIFKKNNWFSSMSDKLLNLGKSNPRRERAINYLKVWSKDFWLDTEHRIKDLEKLIEKKFVNETGLKLSELGFNRNTSSDEKERILTEVKYKAEKIINESQADEIHEIINIMKDDIFDDVHKRYYIIIDDLDKNWISDEKRYELIASMIEVIKEFQILKGVKIVISLRENLYQLVFAGFKHKGGQREKFKPLYINLEWNYEELERLVEKRLEVISEHNVTVHEAFTKIKSGKTDGFKYILERTFMRPRDVISYVNHVIENTNNKSYFTLDIIKKAEISYSKDRLNAIEDEWGENYGNLSSLFMFLRNRYNGFRLRNIKEEDLIDVFMEEDYQSSYKGDLLLIVQKWKNGELKFNTIIKEVVFILYKIGLVGIKKGPTYPIQFFYDYTDEIRKEDLTNDCKIYIHKAFYSVLNVNTKALEAEEY
jgi:hypothetical protein